MQSWPDGSADMCPLALTFDWCGEHISSIPVFQTPVWHDSRCHAADSSADVPVHHTAVYSSMNA